MAEENLQPARRDLCSSHGWLLGNLMKWQNKVGNHLEEDMNTFLVQHPEAGWQKVHPP